MGCEPNRMFYGLIPNIVSELKMVIGPQKTPTAIVQVAQDVLEQTEILIKISESMPCRATLKTKVYYERRVNVSKLKRRDNVYVLQPQAHHQGSKISSTDFRWTGPHIVEKASSNLVRKVVTDKTQVHHRMALASVAPGQTNPTYKPRYWN